MGIVLHQYSIIICLISALLIFDSSCSYIWMIIELLIVIIILIYLLYVILFVCQSVDHGCLVLFCSIYRNSRFV